MPINLIKNGDFEGDIVQGAFIMYTAPEHWDIEYGLGPDIITSDKSRNFFAPSGSDGNYVELDGSGAKSVSNSSISQAVSTTAGKTYALEFDWSPYPGFLSEFSGYDVGLPYLTDQFEVTINGTPVYRYEGTRQIQSISWRRNIIIFTADSSSTLVTFRADQGQGDFGGANLDNVSLVELAPIRGNSLYALVDGPSWTRAEANAVKLGGHLTAITSSEENRWITEAFDAIVTTDEGPWIGLRHIIAGASWSWINGESYAFTAWYPTEPSRTLQNDGVTREDSAHIYLTNQDGSGYHGRRGFWNDIPNDAPIAPEGRGIAEIPFIRRGDSAYVIVQGPTWEEAEANAIELGGHLATINDAAENEWLSLTLQGRLDYPARSANGKPRG